MALLEVGERDKVRETKVKAVRLESDVVESLERYQEFLVKHLGADAKKFPVDRIINDVLRESFKGDRDFRGWQARNGNGNGEPKQ